MEPSTYFCDHCGAGNTEHAAACFACGSLLKTSVHSNSLETDVTTTFSTSRFAPDALLKHRYHLLSLIGKGGFGAVYKAQDTQFNNRLVAIKEMSREHLTMEELHEATEAFKSEAQILAGLMHPNLPRIYDQFNEGGRWYLVMDFIDGETLSDYLKRTGARYLSVSETLEIGLQLCGVLSYLHSRQPPVIFRDLKPENIMRTPEGQLFLIDFGIARHFKLGQAKDTTALGSPGYAAPEQYGKAQTTASADIYSLGATLHFLLSGDDPALNPFRFASLQSCAKYVPPELDSLINCMLDMNPYKRPSDNEVRAGLKRIADVWAENKQGSVAMQSSLQTLSASSSRAGAHIITGWNSANTPSLQQKSQQSFRHTTLSSTPPVVIQRKFVLRNALAFLGGAIVLILSLFLCNAVSTAIKTSSLSQDPNGQPYTIPTYDIPTEVQTNVPTTDTSTGNQILSVLYTLNGVGQNILNVSWSPNGEYIAGNDGSRVLVWKAGISSEASYSLLQRNTSSSSTAIAWSPDSSRLAVGDYDGTVNIWDIFRKAIVSTYHGHTLAIHELAWSPDGKRIASASEDKTVQVWDTTSGQNLVTYKDHNSSVTTVAWSHDGKYIASGGYDQHVRVWNPINGHTIFTYTKHRFPITYLIWSRDDSRIASSDMGAVVHLWQSQSGKDIAQQNSNLNILSLAWSPDNKRLAIGDLDGTIRIWNINNWTSTFYSTGGSINSLTWSPANNALAYPYGQTVQVVSI